MLSIRKLFLFFFLVSLCLSVYISAHEEENPPSEEEMDDLLNDEESNGSDQEGDEQSASSETKSSATSYEVDDEVIVVNAKNFDYVISQFPLLLVEFYAPWCGHCKALAPKYAEAAELLKKHDPPLHLAKLDANDKKNQKIASKYGIDGFPTLKLFRNNTDASTVLNYEGPRSAEGIVQYMKKKYEPIRELSSKDDLKDLEKENEVLAVFVLPKDGPLRSVITEVANTEDDVTFAVTTDKSVLHSEDQGTIKEPGFILYKSFDEGKNIYTEKEFTKEKIVEFIHEHKFPLIMTYSQEKASQIFAGVYTSHVLIFSSDTHESHETILKDIRKAAEEFRKKLLHIIVPVAEVNIMKHFKLEKEHLPAIIIVNMGTTMRKFFFEHQTKELVETLSTGKGTFEDAIYKFEQKYVEGKLKPTLNSQEPIDDAEDAVKTIVGKEFQKRVNETDKDVLLEFYAPWCGHCKTLAPKYEELAEMLSSVDTLMIAKMDATENEVDHPLIEVQGFPTLYFFPGNDKGHPIKYNGAREVPELLKFIKENAHHPVNVDGDEEEEESKEEKETKKEEGGEHEEL